MSQSIISALADQRITSSRLLLERSTAPDQIKELADATSLSLEELRYWACVADLVRVKGIGPLWAEQLVGLGGISSVQDLACYAPEDGESTQQRNEYGLNELSARLHDGHGLRIKPGKVPSVKQLTRAAENAARLAPCTAVTAETDTADAQELIQDTSSFIPLDSAAFLTLIKDRIGAERSASNVIDLKLFGILAIFIVFLWFGGFGYLYLLTYRMRLSGGYLTAQVADLWAIANNLLYSGLGLVALMMAAAAAGLVILYKVVNREIFGKWLIIKLFDQPVHREFYRRILTLKLESEVRGINRGMLVFIILAAALVLLALWGLEQGLTEEETLAKLRLPIVGLGIAISLLISYPSMLFFRQELVIDERVSEASMRRYLLYLITQWMWAPLVIVVFTSYVLPGVLNLHLGLYQDYILPEFEPAIVDQRLAIMDLPADSARGESFKLAELDVFDRTVFNELSTYAAVTSEDLKPLLGFVEHAKSYVFWLFFAGILGLFVFPYFLMGGWGRGLFFLVLVVVANYLEDWLGDTVPTVFGLDSESWGTRLIIPVLLLSVALLFDSLYEAATDDKELCPTCHTPVEESHHHCPYCAAVLPEIGTKAPLDRHISRFLRLLPYKKASDNVRNIAAWGRSISDRFERVSFRIGTKETSKQNGAPAGESRFPRKKVSKAFLLVLFMFVATGLVYLLFRETRPYWLPPQMWLVSSSPIAALTDLPMGLASDGETLWVITGSEGTNGYLYQVDERGNVLQRHELANSLICSGAAWDGYDIWCADPVGNDLIALDPESGNLRQRIASRHKRNPFGMAWDGENLWVAAREEEVFVTLDAYRNSLNGDLTTPFPAVDGTDFHQVYDLAWDGNALWISSSANELLRFDPANGQIMDAYVTRDYPLMGLAWHKGYLYAVDYIGRIYQLDVLW